MLKRHPFTPTFFKLISVRLCLPLLLLSSLSATSFAATTPATNNFPDKPLELQRKQYQQAEHAFKKRHFSTYKRLSKQLTDYPLHPYLEYKSLTRNLSSANSHKVQTFLRKNEDTVIGERFRLKLINHAAKKHQWQTVIDTYRPIFGTSTECKYLNALIQTQQASLSFARIQALWLSPKSQPKSCDSVFKTWEAAGQKTPQLIWQRFKLAMLSSKRQLARFLIKSMPKEDAQIARLWLKIHKRPELVLSDQFLNIKHVDRSAILLHGLKRLSRRDIELAINAYHTLNKQHLNPQQDAEAVRRIGLHLARNHMTDAYEWLSRVPASHIDKQVREWKIRTGIRLSDWNLALNAINQLTTEQQADYRWQYWWAYANEQLGNINDAQGIYLYLANKRSYYGFLAADHLNQPYVFENKPLQPGLELMQTVSQQPEAVRARELFFMGKVLPARREWQRLIKRISTEEKLAASKLAQSWDWHDRAIITMGQTRYRDDIVLRFPFQHEDNVNAWSEKHNIDASWTYAIIRRESAFMPDARSSVGAMGLMQLMPNTARQVARQLKVRYRGRYSLLTSNTNIRLGTGYLQRMLNKLESQHVLATAAYNAGPHRVSKWLPETQQMDAIQWIETIPFTETREYVSNVLAYMVIYEHLMDGDVTRLSSRMPPVPAKNPISISQLNKQKHNAQMQEPSINGPS
jgi:peptidoglycan lytic transglycosylase